MSNAVTTKDLIIAIPAFAGMALGIYNLIRDLLRNRVNLKVVPKSVVAIGTDESDGIVFKWSRYFFDPERNSEWFAIEIINRGNITVTIDTVGFFAKRDKVPIQVYKPMPIDHGDWPRRLLPHEAVTIAASLPDLLSSPKSKNLVAAFAETQSGIIRRGSSKALKQLAEYAKSA